MPTDRSQLRLALEAPRWALGCYARHPFLVVGVSLIPAAERFTVALWGEAFSAPAHVALEVLAEGARVLLVYLVLRIAVLGDERVRRWNHLPVLRRVRAFADRRWPSLLWQGALLLALAAVFNIVPEQVVPLWLPASAHDLYWACLLAAKNLTVIAFTLLWMVAAARQALIEGGRLLEESRSSAG
nr:hypothetical protein [Streptomonospora sp. PA3]